MYRYDLFITSSELPDRLSKEEFIYYYEQMKSGDNNAREKLIVHNIRLVIRVVCCKFFSTSYEPDELVAVGIMGLIKSIDKFDLSKNVEFATFATRVINNEILLFMRKSKKHINNQSLYSTLNTDAEGNELLLEEILEDPNYDLTLDYEHKESLSEVMSFFDELPDRNKKILMLYFGFYNDKRYRQPEIAEIMGISQSSVSKIIKKDLEKLRKLYKNYQEGHFIKVKKDDRRTPIQ